MAVWSYTPQEVLFETIVMPVRTAPVAPGTFVHGRVTDNFTREVRLRYVVTDSIACGSMAAFFDTQNGPAYAFDWRNPNDEVLYRVRFGSEMRVEMFQPGLLRTGEVVFVILVNS